MAILQDLSQQQLIEMVQRLQARGQRKATLKVSDKGAVSMYGLGRFPVTLYRGQWERLLDMAQDIRDFIEDNSDRLSVKE